MRTRRVLLNSALGLAVVAVGVATVTSVGSARTSAPVGQAVAVTRGTLVATVSATGNVEAVRRTQLDLTGSGGTVRKIYVKQGERVSEGDRLVKVDDSSEKRDLETAQAGLASAEARLTTATQSRSGAEVRQDDAGIANAQQSVRNAETSLKAARATYALDSRQQDAIVDEARDAVDDAERDLSRARSALADAEDEAGAEQSTPEETTPPSAGATPAGGPSTSGTSTSDLSSLTSAVGSAESQLDSARAALSSAKRTRSSTLLRDRQSVDTQQSQLASARRQLEQQRAAAAVNAQPARAGAVADAQAQVDSAEVDVAKAEQALADTVLTAPEGGTVADINAVVGQSSSTGASAGGAAADGGSASGSAGSPAASDGSGTSASSSSALVVLTDLRRKQITATVAEVDATKLKTGLKAQASFPASGLTAPGTITAIDTESTVTNNVVEYGITVRLDAGDESVKLGQTASLTITAEEREDVLVVPTSALKTVDDRSTVTRRENGTDTEVTVSTGLVGTDGTEVTAGLAEGDEVVLPVTGS